jgi:phosphinothricin acetyltransferase
VSPCSIRAATPADLPAVADILAHYVRTAHVTFDLEPRSVAAWSEWYERHVAGGPYHLFVAEFDATVAGYATSGPFRPKPGYRRSAEVSVYLRPDATGRGAARALYDALLPALSVDGFHRAYAGIALPNDASIALHENVGFHHVGTFHEVGFKLGRWIDVAWYEREL